MQELSDLWKAIAPDAVNISGDFSLRDFAAAFHHLKPDKALGPDSIFPKLLIHTPFIWRLEGVGKNFERRHDYTFCISPDLAAIAQSCYNGDSSLSSPQSRG